MVNKSTTVGVRADTHYPSAKEFHRKGELHLEALIAGPNFQGLPTDDIAPDYVEDAVADADTQTEFAQSLRLQIANDQFSPA
jgi:hypothetical protein